ncbi:Aste57867_935 [Aphanomyces stellatus]|uniref:Aste57867_935 protein n=1 Tax=Aphanomyces stellatus TaxID=120398 RepID=A0A485K485_9STRA|nr:hypothetical protein As57867_000934 [Aphanomyces stellatus]VFT78158.1 Aste57867_935 [Aphanomyces stellatus]
MVLKPTRLPPNKKTVEEVVLSRKLASSHATGVRSHSSPSHNPPRPTRQLPRRHVQSADTGCASSPLQLDSCALASSQHDEMTHLTAHLNRLNERLETLQLAQEQSVRAPVTADLATVTRIQAPARVDPDPKLAAKVTHAVKEVHAVVHRLDRVFFDVTSAENKRSHAATRLVAAARGYLVRKRHAAAMAFLGAWRLRHTRTFVDSVVRFSMRTFRVDHGVEAMLDRVRRRKLRLVVDEMRDMTLLRRPSRRVQTQAVETRFQKKRIGVLTEMFGSWKSVAIGPRSRKRMVELYRARLTKARAHLESLVRYDVITPEMVKSEMQKANIRTIRDRAVGHRLCMYFRILVAVVWKPMVANMAKSFQHFRDKTILRVGTAWLAHFRTFQLEREIQRVSDRRTFDRFPQYYNIRRIDYHYKRTTERKHFRAWIQLVRRIQQVQKRFEKAARRMLQQMLRAWRIRAAYQHRLRDATVREWKAYCIRIFKVPFQAWLLYILERKQRHGTQAGLIRAFHRRQHRHTTYSFFRIWKHQTMFGHVEGVHSRVELLRTLEQQKAYCLSLEENAVAYQKVIATLETSLADEQARLQAKETELEQLHADTQATRFAMHNAEQQVARTQSLLNAVRDIHPGTIRRIERMYTEDSILAGDLKDVIHLHIMRASEAQQAAVAAYEANVLQDHMHTDAGADQLLLRRVKWVLSRLHLNYNQVTDVFLAPAQDADAMSTQVNQMYALYEFLRSGDTTSLLEENIPMSKESIVLDDTLAVPDEVPSAVLERPELIPSDDQWNKFVQDVSYKFPPKRFVPIQDRIVSFALNRVEEKRLAQWETQKPTIYSRVHAQAKHDTT